jgi:hypothetical protein
MIVTNFAELMSGETHAEIYCLYSGNLVRRLTVTPDRRSVEIDAMMGEHLVVPIDTPIRFEPWVLDRGSMLFPAPADAPEQYRGADLKICGEGDPITYASGERATVEPNA